MNLIDIPDSFRLSSHNKKDMSDKPSFSSIRSKVKKLEWCGNINPIASEALSPSPEKPYYNEIQLLHCEMNKRENIYDVGTVIYREIKYLCIVEFQVDDATSIGACSFKPGKIDQNRNILHTMLFSHWLRKDFLSSNAQKMIDDINSAIRRTTDIADIYQTVTNSIFNYSMSGVSKTKAYSIVYDLIGPGKTSPAKILKYCQPTKIKGLLIHDYEEIWYCLMKHPDTRPIAEKKYRDIEELILQYRIVKGMLSKY